MYSTEKFEDLANEFGVNNSEMLETYEGDLVEATRKSDYDAFMAIRGKLKKFCYNAGPGGRYYFDSMWKEDPRIKKLKQIKEGPIYADVVSMLLECGPSESKDIYALVEGANYKVLQSLIRKKEIQRILGSHVYYLPGHDVSSIVSDIRHKEEKSRRIVEEYAHDADHELSLPSADEVLGKMFSSVEDSLREQGATEEQIGQVFGQKKKRGFFNFWRRKK